MLKNINPSQTNAWKKLQSLYEEMKDTQMKAMFEEDEERAQKFSITWKDFYVDYSKNRINEEVMETLFELAEECELEAAIESMYNGEKINETEDRAVLHTALRDFGVDPIMFEGEDVKPKIEAVKEQIKNFVQDLHSGAIRGYTGEIITDVVNIGIGGSDLGLAFVHEALGAYHHPGIKTHFVSNVDAANIATVLNGLDAETSLFIIASKSFTTQETMTNARTARAWFLETAEDEKHIANHFVAVSTNTEAVTDFGIDPENMFVFWDWVGGRFSISSAIGLAIACAVGYKNFDELLRGMYTMDGHFRRKPKKQNIPIILALISIWYTNFFEAEAEAILPYDQGFDKLALFLQQGFMESNGKYLDRAGQKVDYHTGQILFGSAGTNGQHSFYQLLHQGTRLIPADFIAPAISHYPIGDHHEKLLANFFAQTEALAFGNMHNPAHDFNENIYNNFEGNRPSNSILIKKITPETLGQLIAMYEHKIFVQGVIWNIFSFDQWGVQLGKVLAKGILPELQGDEEVSGHDGSTNGLVTKYKEMRT